MTAAGTILSMPRRTGCACHSGCCAAPSVESNSNDGPDWEGSDYQQRPGRADETCCCMQEGEAESQDCHGGLGKADDRESAGCDRCSTECNCDRLTYAEPRTLEIRRSSVESTVNEIGSCSYDKPKYDRSVVTISRGRTDSTDHSSNPPIYLLQRRLRN
jgi:hypothetical protein